jgi:SAM-dependent methyltransferase
MHAHPLTRPLAGALALAVSFSMAPAFAQEVKRDVIYVPTPHAVVKRMLEMAAVKKGEFHIDLGCGDGRIVVAAARDFGARGFGVDIDPQRIKEANENAQKAKVTKMVEFKIANLFETDISKADTLSLYLLTSINLKLRPTILDTMKTGARVVSQSFAMGDWVPDQKDVVDHKDVYLWYVPAKVAGKWQVEVDGQKIAVNFEQTYQMLKGTAEIAGKTVPVEGRLKGAEIDFSIAPEGAAKRQFHGRVAGDKIDSTGRVTFTAARMK